MAVLKKLHSATLMEALVATVLIVVVFLIASLVLNNLLSNSYRARTHQVKARLTELEYLAIHCRLKVPYREKQDDWQINLTRENTAEGTRLYCRAVNSATGKVVTNSNFYEAY